VGEWNEWARSSARDGRARRRYLGMCCHLREGSARVREMSDELLSVRQRRREFEERVALGDWPCELVPLVHGGEREREPATFKTALKRETAARSRPVGWWPAATLVGSYVAFAALGILCAFTAPSVNASAARHPVPFADGVACHRVARAADHLVVELFVGRPVQLVRALVRLDRAASRPANALRMFPVRLVESLTFSCEADNNTCHDVMLVARKGPNEAQVEVPFSFRYTSPSFEYSRYAPARYQLGLEAELFVVRGYDYYMTKSHMCAVPISDQPEKDEGGVLVSISPDGRLSANASELAKLPVDALRGSPVAKAAKRGECGATAVDLWPPEAGKESSFLAISNHILYETEPEHIRLRREVVELGAQCAQTLPRLARAMSLYDVDCSGEQLPSCRLQPSLPFRRSALSSIRLRVGTDETARVWAAREEAISSLPGLSDSADALSNAIVALVLLVLAAAVMHARKNKSSSEALHLYEHQRNKLRCPETASAAVVSQNGATLENAMFGLFAISARVVVVLWRFAPLANDGHARTCATQLAASILSMANWVQRYFMLQREEAAPRDWTATLLRRQKQHESLIVAGQHKGSTEAPAVEEEDQEEDPLLRLGGSMAVVDSSSAVLLAFSVPPLLVTGMARFDNTARLLVGVTMAITTLQRCAFAAAANALTLEAFYNHRLHHCERDARMVHYAVVLFSWLGQTVSIAITVADLVVSPLSYSVARATVGDSTWARVNLFLAVLCIGLPGTLDTCARLTKFAKRQQGGAT
jgi:hypothetical protein